MSQQQGASGEHQDQQGRRLLSAVERIIEDIDALVARVERMRREADLAPGEHDDVRVGALAKKIVSSYSNRSAVSGGLTALPALLPGVGTVTALVGGALADVALMLKFEVEMALSLTHLYGFDVRQERERQLAFLLASVSTYEASSGRNFFVDVAAAETTAIWNYAPRQVSKLLLTAFGRIALVGLSKGLVKAVPFVGIAVGASVNKLLTGRVGQRCTSELQARRHHAAQARQEAPVVDAWVQE